MGGVGLQSGRGVREDGGNAATGRCTNGHDLARSSGDCALGALAAQHAAVEVAPIDGGEPRELFMVRSRLLPDEDRHRVFLDLCDGNIPRGDADRGG